MAAPIFWWPERPRLLHRSSALFDVFSQAPDYVAERKYNGINCEIKAYRFGADRDFIVEFWNRHNEPIARQERFAHMKERIADQLSSTFGDKLKAIILQGELRDGKVVGVRDQMIIHDVFLIHHATYDFYRGKKIFSERRKILEGVWPIELPAMKSCELVALPHQFKENFSEVFDDVTQDVEIEGIVIKHLFGKLDLGLHASVESKWQYKVRRPSKNYKF